MNSAAGQSCQMICISDVSAQSWNFAVHWNFVQQKELDEAWFDFVIQRLPNVCGMNDVWILRLLNPFVVTENLPSPKGILNKT